MAHQFIDRPPSGSDRFAEAFSRFGQQAASGGAQLMAGREQKKQQLAQMREDSQQAARASKEKEEHQRREHQFQLEKQARDLEAADRAEKAKSQNAQDKNKIESDKALAPLKGGLDTIKKMRAIKARGNLGRNSSFKQIYSAGTRKDRAEYTQLGKSLIQMASAIPIRNQKEFETLAHDLYDPNISDAGMEGILDAMEQIISQNMQEYQQAPGATPQIDQNGIQPAPGMVVKNKKTGQTMQFDGTSWKPL